MHIANENITKDPKFHSFEDASTTILHVMSQFIDLDTLYISSNDEETNQIVKVFNRNTELTYEGYRKPLKETLCRLPLEHGLEVLSIESVAEDTRTNTMNLSEDISAGSFIGVPISYRNGQNYGTLCGISKTQIEFSKEHISLFESMAKLLSDVLELDYAYQTIEEISTPLVPITTGIAILPIVGHISMSRSQLLMTTALEESQKSGLSCLIIDLSATPSFNKFLAETLSTLIQALKLTGINVFITGIRSQLAQNMILTNIRLPDVKTYSSLQMALRDLGVTK